MCEYAHTLISALGTFFSTSSPLLTLLCCGYHAAAPVLCVHEAILDPPNSYVRSTDILLDTLPLFTMPFILSVLVFSCALSLLLSLCLIYSIELHVLIIDCLILDQVMMSLVWSPKAQHCRTYQAIFALVQRVILDSVCSLMMMWDVLTLVW